MNVVQLSSSRKLPPESDLQMRATREYTACKVKVSNQYMFTLPAMLNGSHDVLVMVNGSDRLSEYTTRKVMYTDGKEYHGQGE